MADDVTAEPPAEPPSEPPTEPADAAPTEPTRPTDAAPPGPTAPPPGVVPIEVTPVRVAKRPRRAPLLAVLGVLVVGGVAAAAVVLLRTGGRDADEALAAAHAAVEDADSFRFTIRTTGTLREGDSDNSTETTTRTTEEGEWAAGAWHVTSTDDYSAYETIVAADGTSYDRWSEGEAAAIEPDQQWDRYEVPADSAAGDQPDDIVEAVVELAEDGGLPFPGDDPATPEDAAYADEAAVGLAVTIYLGGGGLAGQGSGLGLLPFWPTSPTGDDPVGFLDAIEAYGEPALDDPRTITATLRAPAELVEALDHPVPDGEVTLTLDAEDRPVDLRLRVAAERASSELALTFADWDGGITVAIPGDDEVDPTPWVEEELIRAVRVAPVVPTEVPEGWEPMVSVMPMDEYYGEGPADCDVLDVSYDEPISDEALEAIEDGAGSFGPELGYVWLYQTTLDCALALDDTPFVPGGPGGLPHRSPGFAPEQVLVGDTAVEVDADLPPDQLEALIASLAVVDVETLVAVASAQPADWTL